MPCNFVLCSAIFMMRSRKCSVDRKVKNRKGDCIVLQEETKERNLGGKKGKLIIDCHLLLPVTMLDASFISS